MSPIKLDDTFTFSNIGALAEACSLLKILLPPEDVSDPLTLLIGTKRRTAVRNIKAWEVVLTEAAINTLHEAATILPVIHKQFVFAWTQQNVNMNDVIVVDLFMKQGLNGSYREFLVSLTRFGGRNVSFAEMNIKSSGDDITVGGFELALVTYLPGNNRVFNYRRDPSSIARIVGKHSYLLFPD